MRFSLTRVLCYTCIPCLCLVFVMKLLTMARMQKAEKKPIYEDIKLIVYATSFYGDDQWDFGSGRRPFLMANCKYNNCAALRGFGINESDAALFHIRERFEPRQLTFTRHMYQRWILFSRESPSYSSVKGLNGVFNWTMTYRRDSDIQTPYNTFLSLTEEERNKELKINKATNKNKLISWKVSLCKTSSKRMTYVKELRKHVPIDIFGQCGQEFPADGYAFLGKHYRFYLSFENSICYDYMTDTVRYAMENNMVPIGLGTPNYEELLPKHSYLDVKWYTSPQALAKHVYVLNSNDSMYNAFFTWKLDLKLVQNRLFMPCELCMALNQDLPSKSYQDIGKWWNDGSCVSPEIYYKGIL